jgi:hypothetical protein
MSYSWNIYDISTKKFSSISVKYLTSCTIIGKIQWDVLAKNGFHVLVEDGVPSLEIVATGDHKYSKPYGTNNIVCPKSNCLK